MLSAPPRLAGFQELLNCLREEWNRAEGDIKQAEQVCSEVINPAINELRYVGRRLVDAMGCADSDGDAKAIEALLTEWTR